MESTPAVSLKIANDQNEMEFSEEQEAILN
jgi:hypothetical protein